MLTSIIAYFVRRHLVTNMLCIAVFIGGVIAWQNTSKEEMPDVTFDTVRVSASYPGATAEEVEHFVTKPIEEELLGLDGIHRITSSASQGATSISIELEPDYPDKDAAIADIKNAVMDVRLPDDVRDDPSVRVFKTSRKAIVDVALIDTTRHLLDVPARQRLQRFALTLENQLVNLPEINSVNKSAYLQEEIQIMVDPKQLIAFDIPFNTVMREVSSNHVRQPAGSIETVREPKVTLSSELDTVDKLKDLIVQGGFEGKVVRLGEVAQVQQAYAKNKEITKVNGHEAVMFSVVKNSSFGILVSLDAVHASVERFRKNNLKGSGIELLLLDDESLDVRNRLSIIAMNGGIGFVLILTILFIFLNFRSGLWVAIGIPFTFSFTMICAYFMGYTINNTTLAAVIIVMGIVVDDAIVVAENIARLRKQGMPSEQAAVEGAGNVFLPIVASIVTTCIAFVPLFFFQGRMGHMNKFIPPIIFFMLGASLIESLLILPGHMHFEIPRMKAYMRKLGKRPRKKIRAHWFERWEDGYGRFLEKMLVWKWVAIGIFVCMLIFSGFLAKSTMKFVMFPNEETRTIVFSGEADADKDRFQTADITQTIEAAILPYLNQEVVGIRTEIARSRRGGAVEENKFRIIAEVVSKDKRKKSADQLQEEWEKKIGDVPGLKELTVSKSRWGQSSGSPIELAVMENDDDVRQAAVQKIYQAMMEHEDLTGAEVERPVTNIEYKIGLQKEKIKRLGIDAADISSTLRAAIEGSVLYELPKGEEEVDVRFTTMDGAKASIEQILDIPVENRGNYLVPLRDVTFLEQTETPNAINRIDRKRMTSVYADIKEGRNRTPLEIAEHFEENVFPNILAEYPSVVLKFEGEIKDTRESQGDLHNAVILVILLIYMILVLLFNSLLKPLIIMLAIPFGVVGVVFTFWLHGKLMFGFFAAIGALGLAGVVINDSIIMLDKLDKEFDPSRGDEHVIPQVASIAKTRLRAVVLTTLTTMAGVLPTAYGVAGYDAMLGDMMLALAWGLLFGSLITLVLIPCAYCILMQLTPRRRRRSRPKGETMAQ